MPLSAFIRTRLAHQLDSIPILVGNLREEQLKQQIVPGKWSAFENIVHLAAYQPAFLYRLQQIMREDGPRFERYVADEDPLFHSYLQKSYGQLLTCLAEQRRLIILESEGWTETALDRIGHHPKYGAIICGQWMEFFLLHEAHHLFTVFMLTRQTLSQQIL